VNWMIQAVSLAKSCKSSEVVSNAGDTSIFKV
jgi:hypothetical protein